MATSTYRSLLAYQAVGAFLLVMLAGLAVASADPLCTDPLVIDKPLGQGTTIKFKAHAGDAKVVIRPDQRLAAGNYRADVAAYHLATGLGLETVPFGCVRRIDRAALEAVAGDALRTRLADELAWADDGTVAISVVAWVDGVKPAKLEESRTRWRAQLAQTEPLAPELAGVAAEGSRLAVWDFLIANWDRWSGGNTFRLADGRFVWLDNAAGFGRELSRTRNARARTMRTTERFSRSLVAALRRLDDAALDALLARADLAPARIADVRARRDLILAHVDALIAAHGEARVLVFE